LVTIPAYIAGMELTETARRLRAARAFGGYRGREDFCQAIEMSPSTLQRIEDGQRALGEGERILIARRCRVPEWFLEDGWDGWRSSVDAEALLALADVDRRSDDRPAKSG
jgi:transcriptional regulator with XRE-family HTH domain